MFTLDLLQGRGLPPKSRPCKAVLMAVPLVLPFVIIGYMVFNYFETQIVIASTQTSIGQIDRSIAKVSGSDAGSEQINRQMNMVKLSHEEIADSIGRYVQFTGVLESLAKSLPESLFFNGIEIFRSTDSIKVPDKNDAEKQVNRETIARTLKISVCGVDLDQSDNDIRDYIAAVKTDELLGKLLTDVSITSRNTGKIGKDDVILYELECPIVSKTEGLN